MKNAVKIAIVDDEILFRKGISFLLERENHINVLFEAANGQELLHALDDKNLQLPDIIIMDLKMPEINGVEATKIIHATYRDIKIIALTSYHTRSFIANMIAVGAVAYLVKNSTPQELIHTINEVANKGFYYTDVVLKIIQEDRVGAKQLKSVFDTNFLTSRELEVLKLICDQKSTAEIAELLFISPRTVEGHRNNLLLKTESKNMAGLVVFALQNELVMLDF
ncbi:MAG: response regulator [Flavobacterium sp.]